MIERRFLKQELTEEDYQKSLQGVIEEIKKEFPDDEELHKGLQDLDITDPENEVLIIAALQQNIDSTKKIIEPQSIIKLFGDYDKDKVLKAAEKIVKAEELLKKLVEIVGELRLEKQAQKSMSAGK